MPCGFEDELVYQIKEKLKVKALAPSSNNLRYSNEKKTRLRASAYGVPKSECGYCEGRRCFHHRCTEPPSRTQTDDPYEALQELLKDGALIKEAVRRLNINCFNPKSNKTIFYDSDEERTPYPFKVEI